MLPSSLRTLIHNFPGTGDPFSGIRLAKEPEELANDPAPRAPHRDSRYWRLWPYRTFHSKIVSRTAIAKVAASQFDRRNAKMNCLLESAPVETIVGCSQSKWSLYWTKLKHSCLLPISMIPLLVGQAGCQLTTHCRSKATLQSPQSLQRSRREKSLDS